MAEIVFKLFFFMAIIIFFSVGFLIKQKLNYYLLHHGINFISINKNYKISTGMISYKSKNIIYIKKYPIECNNGNKNSIKCLSKLETEGGVYNGLVFFSGTNIYK